MKHQRIEDLVSPDALAKGKQEISDILKKYNLSAVIVLQVTKQADFMLQFADYSAIELDDKCQYSSKAIRFGNCI